MRITEFKKIMKRRGYKVLIGYGCGYTLIKEENKYFISTYDIKCLSDISYFRIDEYDFNQEIKRFLK